MRNCKIFLGSALVLAAATSYAAMGAGLGLPINWTTSLASGYNNVVRSGNPASAMCVECHTVNPSSRIPVPAVQRTYPASPALSIERTNAATQGTHTVLNYAGGAFKLTNTGGGFTGAFGGVADDATYLPATAWAVGSTTVLNGTYSRFGNDTATASTSTIGTGVGINLTCESCHSVYVNFNETQGNRLLLGTYYDNGDASICVKCHGTMRTSGNLMAFNGVAQKRHHVLGDAAGIDQLIDNATHYNGGGTASLMWAPYASDKLTPNWCGAGAYSTQVPTVTLNIGTGVNFAFRNACNVAGQGTRDSTALVGDIATTGVSVLTCANCHRPHNAMTKGGAFILRSGTLTTGAVTDFPGYGDEAPFNAAPFAGMKRQSDLGADYADKKLYAEYVVLCAGCHQGYGQ